MVISNYAKNLLEDKTCIKCGLSFFCSKRNKKLYNTCLDWIGKNNVIITGMQNPANEIILEGYSICTLNHIGDKNGSR